MASSALFVLFDSGLGGISVAHEIRRAMPHERVLYFGDSANAPYGTKTPEQVRDLLLGDRIKQALHAAPLWRYFAENRLL